MAARRRTGTLAARRSLGASEERARVAVVDDGVLLGEVMLGAAGVAHRAVLAGVEVFVGVGGEGGETAVDDRVRKELDGGAYRGLFLVQLERELVRLDLGEDERLDRAADFVRAEALRDGDGVERELQAHAAINLLAEVFVARGLAAFVVDDAVAAGAGVDAVDPTFDMDPFHRRFALVLEFLRAEAVRAKVGDVAREEVAQDAPRRGAAHPARLP